MGVKVLNIIITWLFLKFWNIYNKYKLFNNSLTVDVILQHLILVTLKLPSWILCYKKETFAWVTEALSYFTSIRNGKIGFLQAKRDCETFLRCSQFSWWADLAHCISKWTSWAKQWLYLDIHLHQVFEVWSSVLCFQHW